MSTRLYEHPIFLEHVTPAGHPERSDRIRAINVALEHPNFERLDRRKAPAANEDAVLLAHPELFEKSDSPPMRMKRASGEPAP